MSNSPCERVTLSYNNLHDTSKVVFQRRVVFDTTAKQVRGKVIDRSTLFPIASAIVSMKQDNLEYKDTTDVEGAFSVFRNDFNGTWSMTVTHGNYRCLIIDSVVVGGGQDLTVKLRKQL